MDKMKIMVDMDDVITTNAFEKLVTEFLGYELNWNEIGDNFYIQDLLGDKKEEFFKFFITKNLYDYADIKDNCYEVLQKLNEVYDVYICTDYLWREVIEYAGLNLNNKYNYLYQKFPFLDPRKFIFTGDKSIVNCDIKIDDKISNLTGECKYKLLFTEWHNKSLSEELLEENNITRVNNWNEIADMLL